MRHLLPSLRKFTQEIVLVIVASEGSVVHENDIVHGMVHCILTRKRRSARELIGFTYNGVKLVLPVFRGSNESTENVLRYITAVQLPSKLHVLMNSKIVQFEGHERLRFPALSIIYGKQLVGG